jgi:hypothetical protein
MNGRIALVVALFALSAGAGCGGSSHAPPPPTTTTTTTQATSLSTFRNAFLTFRHPQAWRTLRIANSGELHFAPMVYLTTQPGHDPCRQRGLTIVCNWPVNRLLSSGVIVKWANRGFPGWTLATETGTRLRIGGRPATEQTARPGDCRTIGADETVSVQIARPIQYNWTDFIACLRGPNLADREREVRALLASTRFLQP